ncbi:hypothetical protein [Streptomyces sp. NPDC056255]|uniref:hypothetical protein n=1 Tax=Streptomyces sp. NPDC056255 TaxID=3345764 RepID=UPI0035E22ACB
MSEEYLVSGAGAPRGPGINWSRASWLLDVAPLGAIQASAVAAAQAAVDAPDGIGSLIAYATEVALLVKGTWKPPVIGSARVGINGARAGS